MSDSIVARIEANPKYHELRHKRNTFGWTLTILITGIYVRRANGEYDRLTAEILAEANK